MFFGSTKAPRLGVSLSRRCDLGERERNEREGGVVERAGEGSRFQVWKEGKATCASDEARRRVGYK